MPDSLPKCQTRCSVTNPLRGTAAATGAIEQAIHVLRKALGR